MKKCSAIITGSALRIGRSLALGLAQRGFDIGIHYGHSEKEAIETKNEIEKLGRNAILLKCDLADQSQTLKLISMAAEKLSNIELLVNNASIFEKADFFKTDIALLERNFAVHMKAPFILTAEFAKICKRGNVVNIIDAAIAKTDAEYFAYLLSKKSLYDLTMLCAKALAPNIRVNAIAPGSTLQPIDSIDTKYLQKRAQEVPLKIPGDPQYLMQGIDFFLANPFVTGECLFIDGGAHIEC